MNARLAPGVRICDAAMSRSWRLHLVAALAAVIVTDGEVTAIVQKHCVSCHAAKPSHPAFAQPAGDIALESVGQLRQYAAKVYEQTVVNKAMPLGDANGMTQHERDALGLWIKAQPTR